MATIALERSPYLQGDYAPIRDEITAGNLTLAWGRLPDDLAGMFVRTGSNPAVSRQGVRDHGEV